MSISGWISFFTHVLEAEAYRRAEYLPAGSWLEVDLLDELEGESAAYIYGATCSKALLLQTYYKNINQTWRSKVFLVPSESPSLPTIGYRADWSEEHQLFIVKLRSKKSHVINDHALAFDRFNWSYNPVDVRGTSQKSSSENALIESHDLLENVSPLYSVTTQLDVRHAHLLAAGSSMENLVATGTGKSWADINEEDLMENEVEIEDSSTGSDLTKNEDNAPHSVLVDCSQDMSSLPMLSRDLVEHAQLEISPKQHQTFEAFENSFWEIVWDAIEGHTNPAGLPRDDSFVEPAGYYRALSFDCIPQDFISTTTAATSLWAVTSQNVWHWQHGFKTRNHRKADSSPFSRRSILCAQACKTLTPVVYQGPGSILYENVGTDLQEAVTGYAHKSFLPIGTIMQESPDLDDPCMLHNPSDPHWSSLTVPTSYSTPPYYYDYTDYDHAPMPMPYGRPKRKFVRHGSKLKNGTPCYEEENQELEIPEEQECKGLKTAQEHATTSRENHGQNEGIVNLELKVETKDMADEQEGEEEEQDSPTDSSRTQSPTSTNSDPSTQISPISPNFPPILSEDIVSETDNENCYNNTLPTETCNQDDLIEGPDTNVNIEDDNRVNLNVYQNENEDENGDDEHDDNDNDYQDDNNDDDGSKNSTYPGTDTNTNTNPPPFPPLQAASHYEEGQADSISSSSSPFNPDHSHILSQSWSEYTHWRPLTIGVVIGFGIGMAAGLGIGRFRR